ncbi:hypothetical protein DyAD56_09055 [Dyella sp. AD56]|nr:hypothetical protein DyAD56_09055 [Dyella sp. AD56]
MWLFFCLDGVWLGMFWVVALLRLALSWGRPFGRGVDAKRLGRLMPAPSPLWGEGWGEPRKGGKGRVLALSLHL